MPRRLFSIVAVCLVAGLNPDVRATAPLSASDSPLAAVPADAPVVLQIKGVERVRDRIKATLQAAAPDIGAMAAGQLDNVFGQALEGRKLTGVTPGGPVFVAMLAFPKEGDEPPVAVIARVNKYAEFRDSFLKEDERNGLKSAGPGIDRVELNGQEMFLVDRGGYVAIAKAKDFAERLAKAPAGLDSRLPKELTAKFLDNDLTVYANLESINREYGDKIREGRDTMTGLFDQAPGMDKGQAEMIKKVYGAVFQAVTDGKAVVAAFDFRPEGIAVHVQAQVGPDTDTNKLLKAQQPAALAQIGQLPTGQMAYTGYEMSPEATKTMMGMMQGMMTEGDARKAVEAALEKLVAAGGKAAYASSNYPISGVNFQEFEDPAKALVASVAMLKAFSEGTGYMGAMLKSKPEVTPDAETHRSIKFTAVRMVWDLDKMAEMVPGAGEAMKAYYQKLMGEELRLWMGVDGKRFIQVMGKDWAAAKELLDKFLDGNRPVGPTPAFAATRKQLPEKSSLLTLMDAGPLANVMADSFVTMFKAMPALPINLPDSVKPVKTEPAFIGMAIGFQPERGSFDLYIPVTAVQEVRKVVMQLFMGS